LAIGEITGKVETELSGFSHLADGIIRLSLRVTPKTTHLLCLFSMGTRMLMAKGGRTLNFVYLGRAMIRSHRLRTWKFSPGHMKSRNSHRRGNMGDPIDWGCRTEGAARVLYWYALMGTRGIPDAGLMFGVAASCRALV